MQQLSIILTFYIFHTLLSVLFYGPLCAPLCSLHSSPLLLRMVCRCLWLHYFYWIFLWLGPGGEYDNVGTSNGFNRTVLGPRELHVSEEKLVANPGFPLCTHTGSPRLQCNYTLKRTHRLSCWIGMHLMAWHGIAWHITHTPRGALSNKYKFGQHDWGPGIECNAQNGPIYMHYLWPP